MRRLEEMPEVEKTSIFGAAVHAVMRSAAASPEEIAAQLDAAGITARCSRRGTVARRRVPGHRRAERLVEGARRRVQEFRQILRDRRTLMILLFVPAFFLLLYGYALNFDIRNIPLAVQDNDRSSASRERHLRIRATPDTSPSSRTCRATPTSSGALDRGDARAVLVIPGGFGRDAARGQPTSRAAADQRRQRQYRDDGHGLWRRARGRASPHVTSSRRAWHPRTRRSCRRKRGSGTTRSFAARCFLVPGLIAYIAMLTAVVSTALSIVREKEVGTMEQVRMSPVGPLGVRHRQDGALFLRVSCFGDGHHRRFPCGSSICPCADRGRCSPGGVGVSGGRAGVWRADLDPGRTQQVAFQVALLTSYLPTLMLSGFIFPISSMPAALQAITYAVPARYFLIALRGIVLKGVGVAVFWQELAALVVFAASSCRWHRCA